MGAVKAINASRIAMNETEGHKISLDQVIETMRQTGHDMRTKYKETSLGGLAGSGAIRDSVMIYGAHLTLIALVNLLLWIEVRRGAVAHLQIVRSSLALALFVVALAVGAMRPDLALYLWIAVLATPLLGRPLARRFLRT